MRNEDQMLERSAAGIPNISMQVKFRKLREAADAPCPAAKWESFVPGRESPGDVSLPDAYELEGELLAPLAVGQPILVHRASRNGVAVEGLFTSTPVKEIGNGW